MAALRVLVRLGLRSLASHKVKSLIVGGILAFGTFLLAVNTTFLNNIEEAMERSVTRSLIGHAQLVSADAKDDLAFFGQFGSSQDIGLLDNFARVREVVEAVPGVQSVVPMGRDGASAGSGNLLDLALESLRAAVAAGDTPRVEGLKGRMRQLCELVRTDLENRRPISANTAEIDAGLAIVNQVASEPFWAGFDADPAPALELMEGKLAPLLEDGQNLFLAYLGTDLHKFAATFDTFEVVEGTQVPPGERGMLLSKEFYEKQSKNALARLMDELRDARVKDGDRLDDANKAAVVEKVARLGRQYKRLVYELGPVEAAAVESDLRGFLNRPTDGLDALVKELLTVTEQNFDARYGAFYRIVAPRIRLYSVKVGETLTLRAFTRSGYQRALNVKVYGTFRFKGLDGSLLASSYNLIDLMSFRDLYGLMTPEKRRELDAMRAKVGVQDVAAADAESQLFGGDAALEQELKEGAAPVAADEPALAGVGKATVATGDAIAAPGKAPTTSAELEQGAVLNAAVVLAPGALEREVLPRVEQAISDAGLKVKVVNWRQAAGIIGQFVFVMRIVLVVAFIIIFITALAIINNAMLMSMMDRIAEIGTMRAIGAQRRFVLGMFLLESAVLSAGAMVVGSLAAWGFIRGLNAAGLPSAGNQGILVVLFGGPRLNPHLTSTSLLVATGCIGLVSMLATLYPAVVATRVAPVVAMQRRE